MARNQPPEHPQGDTPPPNPKPYWPAIRLAAEQLQNLKEAARLHGVTHDAVKQRARREQWATGSRAPAANSTPPDPAAPRAKGQPPARSSRPANPPAARPGNARKGRGDDGVTSTTTHEAQPADPDTDPRHLPGYIPHPMETLHRQPVTISPDLDAAIRAQDFERAAQIRDRERGILPPENVTPKSSAPALVLNGRDFRPDADQLRKIQIRYTDEIAEKICHLLATGMSLSAICQQSDMPAPSTVYLWVQQNPSFSDNYSRARAAQAHFLAEQVIEISDDGTNDTYQDADGNQKVDQDNIQRSKLRVSARQWYASKLLPRIYGEQEKTAPVQNNLTLNIGAIHAALPPNIRANYQLPGDILAGEPAPIEAELLPDPPPDPPEP